MNFIEIDNILPNPDLIRLQALGLEYTKSDSNGWKGYRCLSKENPLRDELTDIIKDKVIQHDWIFENANWDCYFHYTTKDDVGENKIHQDFLRDFAGVVYLTPNPPNNSGTLFYDEYGSVIHSSTNIYNKLVLYPADIWHSIDTTFGDDIDTGRLTFTIFVNLKQKETKTFI